jgi:hypothetical protein
MFVHKGTENYALAYRCPNSWEIFWWKHLKQGRDNAASA